MASDATARDLLDTAAFFFDSVEALEELDVPPDQLSALLERVRKVLDSRGVSHSARPLGVQRLRCNESNGYPLRRTLLVVFNREGRTVTAEFKEVAGILKIRGVGADEVEAFRDTPR